MVMVCGGRSWDGIVEADDLARMMTAQGVPATAIVRERCSLDTRDNARFGAALLRRRGVAGGERSEQGMRVLLVTCSWHLPRAESLFRRAGLEVEGYGVEPPVPTVGQQLYRHARERLSRWHDERREMRIV